MYKYMGMYMRMYVKLKTRPGAARVRRRVRLRGK
jgi:hypothetical protein